MCMSTEVRIHRGGGDYTGTPEELKLIGEAVQHLILDHEHASNNNVNSSGHLNMVYHSPIDNDNE